MAYFWDGDIAQPAFEDWKRCSNDAARADNSNLVRHNSRKLETTLITVAAFISVLENSMRGVDGSTWLCCDYLLAGYACQKR